MAPRSDSQLLLAMGRGDESAARELHARIGPRLAAYARTFLRDDALADDAVQRAWMRALTRPASELERIRDAMAWMVRVTRSIAINELRRHSRAAARDSAQGKSRPAASSPELGESLAELHAAVRLLPDDRREVVLLRHVAELTLDQMAEALQENRSTLASRYRAAIEELRGHLDGRPTPPPSNPLANTPPRITPAVPPSSPPAKEAQHA